MSAGSLPPGWAERYATWRDWAVPRIRADASDKSMFQSYPSVELGTPPLQPLAAPLSEARVAVVSSGGLSLPGQQPFDGASAEGDGGIRIVAGAGPLHAWRIDHGHYDPAAATEDYNTVFPLDRLRELAEDGEIGAVAPRNVSFHGYQTDAVAVVEELAPAVAAVLEADAVDAALLVPV